MMIMFIMMMMIMMMKVIVGPIPKKPVWIIAVVEETHQEEWIQRKVTLFYVGIVFIDKTYGIQVMLNPLWIM